MKKKTYIDMWYGDEFQPKKYRADATFIPSEGYRGHIYNDDGKIIGDYFCEDSVKIEQMFLISFN